MEECYCTTLWIQHFHSRFFHFWIWIPCCLTMLLGIHFIKWCPMLSFDNFALICIDQNKSLSLVVMVSKQPFPKIKSVNGGLLVKSVNQWNQNRRGGGGGGGGFGRLTYRQDPRPSGKTRPSSRLVLMRDDTHVPRNKLLWAVKTHLARVHPSQQTGQCKHGKTHSNADTRVRVWGRLHYDVGDPVTFKEERARWRGTSHRNSPEPPLSSMHCHRQRPTNAQTSPHRKVLLWFN